MWGILMSIEGFIYNAVIFEFCKEEFHVTSENRATCVAVVFLRECIGTTIFLPDMK